MTTLDALSCYEEVQIRGLSCIILGQDLTLSHASIWTPSESAEIISSCEKCFPLRIRKITFIKLPLGLNALLEFGKLFLSSKMKNRIQLVSDPDSFSHILPQEICQNAAYSLQDSAPKWIELIEAKKALLESISKLEIDEKTDCNKKESSKWNIWPF